MLEVMARRRPVVLAVLLMVAAACGEGDDDDPSRSTTSTAGAATTTAPVTCSAAGLSPDLSTDATLPAPVATMRADLARAAVACDYDALAALVDRDGTSVRYSFGEGDDPVGAWRDAEQSGDEPAPLLALRLLLALPHGVGENEGAPTLYQWPAAFATEHPTDAQLREIAETGLYDLETLEQWVAAGTNYFGYRVLISETGDWQAFVAGD